MPITERIQNLINSLDTGRLPRYLRIFTLCLALLGLALLHDFHTYRNLDAPEAMDQAQLARNISEGKGYTTLFIRPLSIYLVEKRNNEAPGKQPGMDFARLNAMHPDLANPPLYPVVLAALMKVLPFHFAVNLNKPFWSEAGKFSVYEPDFLIALFNQMLLMVVVVQTYLIARKLFDSLAAVLAALLVIGCELLWQFSSSGLSTMLLLVIFMGLTWCLLKIEELSGEPQPQARRLMKLAVTVGALAGVGALTRYAFGWLIVPVAVFLFCFSGQRRLAHLLAALATFAVLLSPWVLRNYLASGTPFGTATFAVVETTPAFPRFQLERSLSPDFTNAYWLDAYIQKLLINGRDLLANGLPRLAGLTGALFTAGLLLGFRNPAARRMRYFLLMCGGTLFVAQALGQTQLSVESPDLNTENLLVLLTPLVIIYGVSFFLTLLDQMKLSVPQMRYLIMIAFVAVACLPMIFALLPPKTSPVTYPPYYPPEIQQTSGWMDENELMMSDVPWAVAWYGQRQCIWLTLDAQDSFLAVSDYIKPVQALYLTPETMDGKFLTDWVRAREFSWGNFIITAQLQKTIPPQFPLRESPTGFLPERLFLTDHQRWKMNQ